MFGLSTIKVCPESCISLTKGSLKELIKSFALKGGVRKSFLPKIKRVVAETFAALFNPESYSAQAFKS